MSISTKDVFAALAGVAVVSLTYAVVSIVAGETAGLALGMAVGVGFVVLVIAEAHKRSRVSQKRSMDQIQANLKQERAQLEAMMSVMSVVRPEYTLPKTGGFAASPDFLRLLAEHVLRVKPSLLVECGSGVSTIIGGYLLRKLGSGRLISLDHEREYAEKTREMVRSHGLEDVVTVVHAPLVEQGAGKSRGLWYDISGVDFSPGIGMLVIDGPPKSTQSLARYPAIPLLNTHLRAGTVILLDDGGRDEEKKTVEQWKAEYPNLETGYLPLEKGAYALKWHMKTLIPG